MGGIALPLQADELLPLLADVTPATTVGPGQASLFTMRRDWSPVLARLRSRPPGELPLTDAAAALVEDFAELRRDQQASGFRKNIRTPPSWATGSESRTRSTSAMFTT
ncbi:hypothetical protein ACFWWT_44790 [Streptomyces sp. NPDC058676]|uniref:hypothetical protein n=1 Tax=unclassified Streptomyces TaxID=2593676 RepID=UPI0036519D72